MNVTSSSGKKDINTLFKSMNLSAAVDSQKLALEWLKKQENCFYGFVGGHYLSKEEVCKDGKLSGEMHELKNCVTGEHLCNVYCLLDNFFFSDKYLKYLKNSEDGFFKWGSLAPSSRSKLLYSVAQMIEKHQDLFSVVEAISSGKQISKVKTNDVPQLIESFNYYAGCTMEPGKMSLESDEDKWNKWFPLGPVCVVAEEYNNPSITLSLRVSSLLASGNSVLILADVKSCLSAFLLAELCYKSGIPEDVVNVLPVHETKFLERGGSDEYVKKVFDLSLLNFRKLIFTGSLERSSLYLRSFSTADIPYEILVPRRPVVIVYENCDLHSAVNGVLEAFLSHDARSTSGGCKVMIQESICEKFLQVFKKHFTEILIDHNMTRTDKSCAITEEQKEVLTKYIKEAERIGGKVTSLSQVESKNLTYCHMMPVLISNLPTNFKLVHEELGGPIIVSVPFRTVKESISMFNSDNKGSQVSIWSEKISVALEVASKLRTGCIWVNTVNIIDSAIPFNGVYFSGNSIEGGRDAFFSHLSCVKFPGDPNRLSSKDSQKTTFLVQDVREGVKEYKLFIGGNFTCSNNGLIRLDEVTYIPSGTEADIQTAVSSAVSIQPRWDTFSESDKRKVLLRIKEKLNLKEDEFVSELQKVLGNTVEECEKEVRDTYDLLYYWATSSDKFTGNAKEIKKNVMVVQSRNPLGVIGIQCPDVKPLLSFVSLVIAAVSFGNAVVAIASSKYPTLALKMSEVFSSASVPGGVINIVCGNSSTLIPALCRNMDVNAIWFTDVPNSETYSNCNYTQRVFNCQETWNDFNEAKSLKIALESTFSKTIFLPFGEIFAN